MTTMNYRQEIVLMDGTHIYTAGVAAETAIATLHGADSNNIFVMAERASTYIVYGYVNGNWIALHAGSLAALIPKVFILNDTVPARIKLSITPTAIASHVVVVVTTYPFRMEEFEAVTAPALSWFVPAGVATYQLVPPFAVALDASDIEIGAVELKNADSDDRAKIAATGSIAEGNIVVGVQAPVFGVTTGAAVETDAAGTIQQYLRGLVKNLIAVAGVTTGAAVETDAAGTLQQYLRGLVKNLISVAGVTTGAAVVTDAVGTLQQYLRGAVTLLAAVNTKITTCDTGAIAGAVTASITGDTVPINCNAPAVPVAIAAAVWTDISAALVSGARYELIYIPTVVTDEVYFYLRDDTAANLIAAVATYGRPCRSGAPIPITPSGATPLALLRHAATAFDGTVYLTRVDN